LSGLTPVGLVTTETITQDSEPLTLYFQMLATRIYLYRLFDPLGTMNVFEIVAFFDTSRIVWFVVMMWVLLKC
jgi:hypothetical protein